MTILIRKTHRRRHFACAGVLSMGSLVFGMMLSGQVFAQENLGDGSTVVYPATYFMEYAPVTALDMVNRIPGMNISGGNGGPGNASRGGRGLVPVDVDNADTTVEEMRYEPFVIHNWQINPRMSLETSLVYEYSEIEQIGEFNQLRDFSYFKPKFDYRFDITPQLQLRMLVEKNVRQINFVDFVAVTDPEDDDSNTLAGNRNLRPDYWWNYNVTAEYRLPERRRFLGHVRDGILEELEKRCSQSGRVLTLRMSGTF